MILVWGPSSDGPLCAVRDALIERDVELLILEPSQLMAARMRHEPQGFVLTLPSREYPLHEITACYPRPYGGLLPDMSSARHPSAQRHLQRMEYLLWQWSSQTRATVVNRPSPVQPTPPRPLKHSWRRPVDLACHPHW